MASTNRVFNLLDTKPEILSGDQVLPLAEVQGDIIFDDVTFDYGNGDGPTVSRRTRGGVLQISPVPHSAGRKLGRAVGATGAGQKHGGQAVAAFLRRAGGRILPDGRDLRTLEMTICAGPSAL
ncbi:MAG: hypothetical protein R3A10_00650 [Caldilineaceae bacterium]